MEKKKVFIVYGSEDYDLTQNFVDKFGDYNPDLEIFYDKNAYSNNINDQLIGYAKNCDLAVILTSARLTNPNHYSNKNEIPILKRRRNDGEVEIVAVRLTDADISQWNNDWEIPFLQQRFSDFRTSRRTDSYAERSNTEWVVYELLEPRDRNTFHKKLKEWIQTILKKK